MSLGNKLEKGRGGIFSIYSEVFWKFGGNSSMFGRQARVEDKLRTEEHRVA